MNKDKPTGPAQPDHIEEPRERSPARKKDARREEAKTDKDDMPGADGERSAGASEDTYD